MRKVVEAEVMAGVGHRVIGGEALVFQWSHGMAGDFERETSS